MRNINGEIANEANSMIDAYGIGKTTIFKELVERRIKSDSWMTPEEAKIKIASIRSRQTTKPGEDYFIAALLKIGVFIYIQLRLASWVLHRYRERIA